MFFVFLNCLVWVRGLTFRFRRRVRCRILYLLWFLIVFLVLCVFGILSSVCSVFVVFLIFLCFCVWFLCDFMWVCGVCVCLWMCVCGWIIRNGYCGVWGCFFCYWVLEFCVWFCVRMKVLICFCCVVCVFVMMWIWCVEGCESGEVRSRSGRERDGDVWLKCVCVWLWYVMFVWVIIMMIMWVSGVIMCWFKIWWIWWVACSVRRANCREIKICVDLC